MSVKEILMCKRAKCGGQLTVPIKLVIKGNRVVDVARCPICHRSYKFMLPLGDKDQWMPLVGPEFFTCDICGTSNADNVQHQRHPWMSSRTRNRIVIHCKRCGKARAKIVSTRLWDDIIAQLKKPTEIPPAPALVCPHCNAEIDETMKFCPSCNVEIVCDKCGAAIHPGASFCANCGDPVEKFEAPAVEGFENLCPTCNEENDADAIYCSVCGQGLICDHCLTKVREGADFCIECGTAIKKGDLSE